MESSAKRKREDGDEDAILKKSKTAGIEEASHPVNGQARGASEAPSEARSTGPKRDREHTSVIVKKLPLDTTQTRIRQFFTDAGTVRNLVMKEEKDSLTAIVEFESPEEADYALSKEAKDSKATTYRSSEARARRCTLRTTRRMPTKPGYGSSTARLERSSAFASHRSSLMPTAGFATYSSLQLNRQLPQHNWMVLMSRA